MSEYLDNVLIKLKRKYGKDETVAALIKKLSESEVEIGTLKAEIDHLQAQLTLTKKDNERELRIEAKKSEVYQAKAKECTILKKEIEKLRKERSQYIQKYHALELEKANNWNNKIENLKP